MAVACAAWGCNGKGKTPAKQGAPARATIDAAAVPAAPVDAAVAALPIDGPPEPLTPAPGERGVQLVDLTYGGFHAPGLPAIREDGSEVAALVAPDDGGRGYLNLRMLVLDGATGAVKRTLPLAGAQETSDAEQKDDAAGNFAEEDALAAKVRQRVADANAMFAGARWRTLESIERPDADPPGPSESLVVGDVTFTYDLGQRRLTVTRGGKQVAAHDLSKLVPRPSTRTDTPCPGDLGYLEALHVDAATRKVLVEIGAYSQGHNCGSDGSVYTVIPLP